MEVLYPRCAGLDVHSRCVNACARIAAGRKVTTEHREFATTTAGLLELAAWLTEAGCTHVAMEATGVYWKPVWHVLEDDVAVAASMLTAAYFMLRDETDYHDLGGRYLANRDKQRVTQSLLLGVEVEVKAA